MGHARLVILDLSAAGHQPIVAARNRYVIALNGEVYSPLRCAPGLNSLDPRPLELMETDR